MYISLENIVQEFHKQTVFHKTKSYPRRLKNPLESKYMEYENDFKNFIQFVHKNNGFVNWQLYIECLAEFYKGWFSPTILTKQKAIKIYRNYVNERKFDNPLESVKKSLKFVFKYMLDHHINSLEEYLTENQYLIPTMAVHHSAGSISSYFLCIFKDIKSIVNSFPQDIKDEFFSNFFDDYELIRAKLLRNKTLRKIIDNPYIIMNKQYNKFINKSNNQKGNQNMT